MNEKQKIELGDFISEKVSKYLTPGSKLAFPLFKADELEIAEAVLNKVHELIQISVETPDPDKNALPCTCRNLFGQGIHNSVHICGVCYAEKCNVCLVEDFGICVDCMRAGKEKIIIQDKNKNCFQAGDTLRNESSLTTTTKILQINKTHIVHDPKGVTEIQDFINAGWIVHVRVTKFEVEAITDEVENCVTQCEFMPSKIGSIGCGGCNYHKGYSGDQHWVICELYNKENEDEK
jgi:hypothetical protein